MFDKIINFIRKTEKVLKELTRLCGVIVKFLLELTTVVTIFKLLLDCFK